MEGPSSKQANIYSDNPGSQSMDTFNHPAPPPAYQPHLYPPLNPGPAPTIIQHPPVIVTQQQHSGVTVTQQQHHGVTVTQHPGVTITQQPGVTVLQPGVPVTSTAVVGNTVVQAVYLQPLLGRSPAVVQCRSCNYQTTTRVEYQPSTRTHLAALICCITLMWPCAFLPYCMTECQSAQHYCSNCGAYVGSH